MMALTVVSGGAVAAAAAVVASGKGGTLEGWVAWLLLAIILATGVAIIVWIWRERK